MLKHKIRDFSIKVDWTFILEMLSTKAILAVYAVILQIDGNLPCNATGVIMAR
ncbi:hypothetical protein ACGRH2_01655 [Vibrio barjaei]|uniref:Uncharacterized protein n=1 Tax=Vibrio barjaei TaxID=1676683 RepID=A0ABW7IC37_9VIBR